MPHVPAVSGLLTLPRRTARALSRAAALTLYLYVGLALALFRTTWGSPRTSWIGICCDPEQTMWFLRWTPYAVTHLHTPWFTDHLNYPDGVNLMWNTAMSLPSLVLSPVTLIFGPVVAYNALITINVVLAAWCAFLAIRRYTTRQISAVVGGMLYGFSPYMLAQSLSHGSLTVTFIPPLMLIVLDEILVRRRHSTTRLGFTLGVLATGQLLSSEELLVTEIIAALVLVAVLGALRPTLVRSAMRRAGPAFLTAAYTFLLMAAWPLHTQFFGAERVIGTAQAPDAFVNDLLNFVVPTDVQMIAPDAAVKTSSHYTGLGPEFNGYIGFPLLLLLGFAAGRLWGSLVVRAAAIAGLVIAILSLGPHVHIDGEITAFPLPWAAIVRLPFLSDVLPSRLGLYLYLCVAVMLAVFVDAVLASQARRTRVLGLAASAFALVFLVPAQPFASSPTTIPEFFEHFDTSGVPDGSVVLIAPFIRDGGEADPMLWQAVAGDGFRMPQGYYFIPDARGNPVYGAIPTVTSDAMETIQEQGVRVKLAGPALSASDRELRERNVATVVVGPMSNRDAMVDFFTALFHRAPEVTGGVEIWRHVDRQGVDLNG